VKIINIIFFIIFLSCAIVQLNDPDPILWFVIYFIIALLNIIGKEGSLIKLFTLFYAFIIVTILISTIYQYINIDLYSNVVQQDLIGMKTYDIELKREFGGIILILLNIWYLIKFD
tara:strand:+ start:118 stop:465 length:348 start_codon:yes stop_codon:yes gene_type:complete